MVFLRGVNVGGRVIKMAEVKVCFETMGFQDVKTVLQSGNVVFETDGVETAALKSEIEKALTKAFDYPAKVQVLPRERLREIAAACPYADNDDSFHAYVIFLEDGLDKDLVREKVELTPGEKVQAGEGVVYWRCPRGNTLQSQFGKLLGRAKYRDFNTNRNLRTLQKLLND